MPREERKITILERQLGLKFARGISRATRESRQLPALDLLLTGIDTLKKSYQAQISDPSADLCELRQEVDVLFDGLGPILWPDLSVVCPWLTTTDWEGLWARRLVFEDPEDRSTLRRHFQDLIYAKCLGYCRNQQQAAKQRISRDETGPITLKDVPEHSENEPEDPYARHYVTPVSSSRGQATTDAAMYAPTAHMVGGPTEHATTRLTHGQSAPSAENIVVASRHLPKYSSPQVPSTYQEPGPPTVPWTPSPSPGPARPLVRKHKRVRNSSLGESISSARTHKAAKGAAVMSPQQADRVAGQAAQPSGLCSSPYPSASDESRPPATPASTQDQDDTQRAGATTGTGMPGNTRPPRHAYVESAPSSRSQSAAPPDGRMSGPNIEQQQQVPQSGCVVDQLGHGPHTMDSTPRSCLVPVDGIQETNNISRSGSEHNGTTGLSMALPANDQGVMKIESEDNSFQRAPNQATTSSSNVPATLSSTIDLSASDSGSDATTDDSVGTTQQHSESNESIELPRPTTSHAPGLHAPANATRAVIAAGTADQSSDRPASNAGLSTTANDGSMRAPQSRQGVQGSSVQPPGSSRRGRGSTPPRSPVPGRSSAGTSQRKVFIIEVRPLNTNYHPYVEVDAETSVEDLFKKVQTELARRLNGVAVELEIRAQDGSDDDFYLVTRTSPIAWRMCIRKFSSLPGNEVHLHGWVVVGE